MKEILAPAFDWNFSTKTQNWEILICGHQDVTSSDNRIGAYGVLAALLS